MLTTIAIAEALAATGAFAALAFQHQRARIALRKAKWRVETLEHFEQRRIERAKRRAGMGQRRDKEGRFA